ncbi:MAG: hypothetical protein HWN68_16995 [Desulfobacterales bacterium]|nr:hypothetical protein [Desulfobacterales bacterium]
MMHGWKKRALVLALMITFILTTTGFQAAATEHDLGEEPTGLAMIVDFVFLRPLGIAAMAVGSVFFVASLPFSVLGGNVKLAFRELVGKPAKFTFARPLGKVD